MDKWEKFKKWIEDYYKEHNVNCGNITKNDRYCVAISCEDLLEKMKNLEEK